MLSLPFVVVSRNPTPPPSAAIVAEGGSGGETLCYAACGSVVGRSNLAPCLGATASCLVFEPGCGEPALPVHNATTPPPVATSREHDRPKHDAHGK
jgi:hypothetical protein